MCPFYCQWLVELLAYFAISNNAVAKDCVSPALVHVQEFLQGIVSQTLAACHLEGLVKPQIAGLYPVFDSVSGLGPSYGARDLTQGLKGTW